MANVVPVSANTEAAAPKQPGIDEYVEELKEITENTQKGNDAIEFAADFWHRLSKIEEAYAKSLKDLCVSRTAKLTRMFASSSCETVPPMAAAWNTCVSDLQTMAAAHGQASAKLKQNSDQLYVYSKEKLKNQITKSTMARRVVHDLKAERTKLGYGLLRYRKLCKDAYDVKLQQEADPEFDPSADNPALLQAEAQKTKQSEIYKAGLGVYERAHTQTFEMAIPGLLCDMQVCEEERVQTFKESITTALITVSERAGSVSFTKTMDAIAAVTPELVDTCKMVSTPPNPPIFTEPTIEQMYGQEVPIAVAPSVATVAKDSAAATAAAAEAATPAVETHPKKDEKSFFSSWFSKKAEARPAKTAETPPPNMYSTSTTSAVSLAAAAVPSSQSSAAAPIAPPSPARPYVIPEQPKTQTWKEEAEAEAIAEAARKQSLDESRRASIDADVSENSDQRAAASAMAAAPTAAWSELDDTPPTTPPKKEEASAAPVPIAEEPVAAPAPADPPRDDDDEDETF